MKDFRFYSGTFMMNCDCGEPIAFHVPYEREKDNPLPLVGHSFCPKCARRLESIQIVWTLEVVR